MKYKIKISKFEEHERCNFYSFYISGNKECEMERFINTMLNAGLENDLEKIVAQLTNIGKRGGEERYFRREGKFRDNVFALPAHYLVRSNCRLYCLRYGDVLLVLGNGGVKSTRTYQDDPFLNDCVLMLQLIDRTIKNYMARGQIKIVGKTIAGDLEFFIEKP